MIAMAEEDLKKQYPPIPVQYWFVANRESIDTSDTDPTLQEDEIVVSSYNTLGGTIVYGLKIFRTRKQVLALYMALGKALGKDEAKK